MEKKLILVTSPPACGKTYVAKALAKNLKHVVYLDKDTLIVLSKQIVTRGKSRGRTPANGWNTGAPMATMIHTACKSIRTL